MNSPHGLPSDAARGDRFCAGTSRHAYAILQTSGSIGAGGVVSGVTVV